MTNNFTRVADKIKDQIKQLIQARQLAVGDRLPSERDLAELFEVSRSAVREAIRALNSQGLVVTRPGGGTFVPVSYTHLTLPTTRLVCRSRWSPYH